MDAWPARATMHAPIGDRFAMDASNNASPLRLVARLGHGQGWIPDGITEVVSHTDGRFLTLTVTRLVGSRGVVEIREFDCDVADACLRAVREWLHSLALVEGASADEYVAAWADDAARQLVPLPHPAHS